jgi:hypothetical protein
MNAPYPPHRTTRRAFIVQSGAGLAGVLGLGAIELHPRSTSAKPVNQALSILAPVRSPRLYVGADLAANLRDRLHSPFLRTLAQKVIADADWLVQTPPLVEGAAPSYSVGGRWVQSHLECLTCAWLLTRQAKYREAALRHLAGLLQWNHISCEAKANTPPEQELPYCLTYGEQSTAIALMYDHFRPDLTAEEQRVFFAVLDRFHLKQAVKCLTRPPWWANKSWSNWNGVCSGGIGMLALAFYDDRPEAQPLIPFVETSLNAYFNSYVTNGGGCPEGTGYWNYGMNYAMRYILSWENATGENHPALDIKELGQSLYFPVDFTGLSFGDNDGWHPTAFFFLLARRLKLHHAAYRAAAYLPERVDLNEKRRQQFTANGDLLYGADAIPTVDEMRQLKDKHARAKVPVARIYRGMDWAVLADDEAFPNLRMSIRGGSAKVEGHGMVDLLSFKCRVNGELMIADQQESGYLVPTFGRRGTDLYTRGPHSKSTLFVEGLGCDKDAACDETQVIEGRGLAGVRINATRIYLPRMPVRFIGRLFLFVDHAYWLVVDHVLSNDKVNPLGIESRFHTYADCRRSGDHVALVKDSERMQMTFAALQPGVLQESRGMPAAATAPQTTIFRWMGRQRVADNLHVVALHPGGDRLGLELSRDADDTYRIAITRPSHAARTIHLTSDLHLAANTATGSSGRTAE